ncbi:MAG TPA: hypothetical protein VGQ56_10355 [Gemmatimonadaceae bacterium]|nr:hypothetical protein [Gemmatimonadaceae bacterium]
MSAVSINPPTSPYPSLSTIARALAGLLPNSQSVDGGPALELITANAQPTRLISATIIEGRALRARRVFDAPVVEFAAFLDGTQQSFVACYLPGGVPIVYGTVGAVIRDRRNQRLFTWRHLVEHRLYAPRANVSPAVWRSLAETGIAVHDTSETLAPDTPSEHPHALREAAVHRVQKDRETAEQSLALEWCAREERRLLVDGGISGADQVARSSCAIGVIKSHRTLYASGEALVIVLGLGYAERSSVFLVTSPKRASVASWYLRIRDPRGHDPMWGLVRVEVAPPAAGGDAGVGRRADEVSRWILAEVAPVALPDGRWDKMVYGVRDCEEFLRAIM